MLNAATPRFFFFPWFHMAERKVTRVAVVTGANKGIGLAIVRGLCRQFRGDVYLTSRDGEKGQDAIERMNCEGFMPKYQQLDITSADSILKLKTFLMDRYGGIDVLVNNAGIAYSPSSAVPVGEQAQCTIDTNFTGTLNMMRTFASITRSHGRIVNLSSFVCDLSRLKNQRLRDRFNSPALTEAELVKLMEEYLSAVKEDKVVENGWVVGHYAASKMGITAMTKVFAREASTFGTEDVLINACCPGLVRTDLGGEKAPLSPNQGAETPIMLALMPPGSPNGMFWREKTISPWR